jgi:hypothetical protein
MLLNKYVYTFIALSRLFIINLDTNCDRLLQTLSNIKLEFEVIRVSWANNRQLIAYLYWFLAWLTLGVQVSWTWECLWLSVVVIIGDRISLEWPRVRRHQLSICYENRCFRKDYTTPNIIFIRYRITLKEFNQLKTFAEFEWIIISDISPYISPYALPCFLHISFPFPPQVRLICLPCNSKLYSVSATE